MATDTKVNIVVDVKNEEEIQKLVNDMKELARTLPRAQKAQKGLVRQTKQTQIEMRKFGRGMQNASYQIQDFITQVTGGVSPLVSFGQQMPQLLINMGALGAVVGVVAASLPILIQQFSDGEDEAKSLDDAMSDLNAAFAETASVTKGVDFTGFIDDWNESTVAIRKTKLAMLEFNVELARRAFDDSLASLASKSGEAVADSWFDAFVKTALKWDKEISNKLGISSLDDLYGADVQLSSTIDRASGLGISAEDLLYLEQAIDQFDRGKLSVQDYAAQLRKFILDNDNASSTLVRMAREAGALEQAVEELVRQQKLLNSASGGGILAGGTPPKKPRESKFVDPRHGPGRKEFYEQQKANAAQAASLAKLAESYTMLYDPLARYEAELQKIIQIQGQLTPEVTAKAVEAAAKSYEQATEQITFASQAAEVFEQSFNTAFDGVAMGTQQVSDAFRNMAKVIIAQLLKIAAYKTIAGFDWTGGTFGGQTAWGSTSAKGNAFSGGNVVPFAKGGVVNTPTIFPMARGGVGLMGEAGSEAVMPLKRMGNGNLGVESSGMNVTVNNMAQGVSVNPRQGSDGLTIDVVLAQAARAVQSGGNVFADSIEKTYSVNRGRGVY